jgi:flavin-dependent dehydrogenase
VVSHGIRRCEFDDYLLRRTGCELRLNESLRRLEREGEHWVLNGSIRARWVIGAGGHFCPVAKLVVPRPPEQEEPVVLAQESEFELTDDELARCPISGDRPELYFCPDLAGYGWIVRKGRYLNVGLGREHERHLGDHVAAFLTFLRERGRLTLEPKEPFRGHAYRLRRYAPVLDPPEGILLIGDSVGLAAPQSGEGIRPAIESGLIAAKVLRELPETPQKAVAAAFRAQFIHRFGAPRARALESSAWARRLRCLAAAGLMRTRWFTQRVLLDQWFLGRQLEPLFAES